MEFFGFWTKFRNFFNDLTHSKMVLLKSICDLDSTKNLQIELVIKNCTGLLLLTDTDGNIWLPTNLDNISYSRV